MGGNNIALSMIDDNLENYFNLISCIGK